MPDAVQLVGGDARRDVAADLVEGLRGDLPGDPDPGDRVGVLDLGPGEPGRPGRPTYSGAGIDAGTWRVGDRRPAVTVDMDPV